MSRIFTRPNQAVDYGQVQTYGAGNTLGDDNQGTGKWYVEDAGSILVYPTFIPSSIPSGRQILAVRAVHNQANGGTFGVFNGWVCGYLRINNVRVPSTKTYTQDGSGGARQIVGPALYKPGLVPWTVPEINTMSTDVGSIVGEFGPNGNNRWCGATESYIAIVLDDDVPIPNTPFPANGTTINSSSVQFSATAVPTQPEQPIAAIFQVARDAAFTDGVKTFIGGLNQSIVAGSKSYYASVRNDPSYTNLGPGTWYMRLKGRDYRSVDSAWGPTTTFSIVHGALPVPALTRPVPGTSSPTPYGIRESTLATDPVGDRLVGAEWRFSKLSDFSSGIVTWKNKTGGRFDKGPTQYDAQPSSTISPGMFGPGVSTDDPDQYLAQGTWYAQVRAHDVFGQVGAWSGNYQFTVSHPPVVTSVFPAQGASFDDDIASVTWKFTDPWLGDTQSRWDVSISDQQGNAIFTNSSFSAAPQAKVVISDIYLQQTLNLYIAVYDRDGVKSNVSASSFILSRAPVITLPYPAANEVVITGQPTINWSVVYSRAGITQKSFRLDFIRRDTAVVEYTTGFVNSSQTSWSAPSPVLKNESLYQLAVTITDSENLQSTLLRNFSTNYIRPPMILSNAFGEDYDTDGYVTVLYPSAQVDPLFVEYRIYRKDLDVSPQVWTQVGTVTDQSDFEFHDWSVSGKHRNRYSVTQVVLLYGSKVESLQDETGDIVKVSPTDYWFIVPDSEELNVRLYHVTGDKFTNKIESSDYVIIGGGRRVNYGTRIGWDGSLTAQIRDNVGMSASQQLQILEDLQLDTGWVMMRDPFGNYTKIAIGDISNSRIAGTTGEYVDIEVPYMEVM